MAVLGVDRKINGKGIVESIYEKRCLVAVSREKDDDMWRDLDDGTWLDMLSLHGTKEFWDLGNPRSHCNRTIFAPIQVSRPC